MLLDSPAAAPAPATLRIERIEIEGNSRTPASLAIAACGLQVGEPATPSRLQAAAARLREAGLFRQVSVHTRPGSAAGSIVVVFRVAENGVSLRLGVGYEDLSGWYLIPAQLNLDNLTGHGERFHLSSRLGYRHQGLVLTQRRFARAEPRRFWEATLLGESENRLYFYEQAELSHRISRSSVRLKLGHPLGSHTAVEGWAAYESVDPASRATVTNKQESTLWDTGAKVESEELPVEIRGDLTERGQSRLGLALILDTRRGEELRTRGLWGRALVEAVLSPEDDFNLLELDLRGYRPLGERLALAGRARIGRVTADAPFFERFYLGGLYTVRGYPSQSLSPPGGNLRFAVASLELRAPWIGPPENPLLTGILFADYGLGWDAGEPTAERGRASIGYGFRLRIPWIGRFGIDVGRPIDETPVAEAFHINGCIGWTY